MLQRIVFVQRNEYFSSSRDEKGSYGKNRVDLMTSLPRTIHPLNTAVFGTSTAFPWLPRLWPL